MMKRLQAAKRIFTSMIEMANIINSYCLSLLWYPAPVLPISKKTVNKVYKIINWALWSKDMSFDSNKVYASKMKKERLAIPKSSSPGLQIPFI